MVWELSGHDEYCCQARPPFSGQRTDSDESTRAHVQLCVGEGVLDGSGEEVGWLESIAGDESAPRLTIVLVPP